MKREPDVFNKDKLNDFIMDIEPEFQLELDTIIKIKEGNKYE